MRENIGSKVLVKTEGWFCGTDGKEYKAIHGTLKGIHEAKDILGFVPSKGNANWYVEIGDVYIAGCQILYMIKCEEVNLEPVESWDTINGEVKKSVRPSVIFQTK